MRVLSATLALVMLGGCYRLHTRPEEAPDGGTDATVDRPDAEPSCATGPFEVMRHEVIFEAAAPPCPWSADDNGAPEQATAAARIEQTHPLGSHSGARLCSLGLDFGPSGSRFQYDDNFFLLFGDVVLAASDRDLAERLPRDGDFRIWDWGAIVGTPMAVVDNVPYCLGADEGRARCRIPRTEEAGIAQLEFDSGLVEELVARGGPTTMGFVTIGDNDPEVDCAHETFSFDFVGTYLAPEP